MELPPYRVPSLKTSLRHTWDKGVQYLKKMGGLILFASIVVWALNYFPIHDKDNNKPIVIETSAIDPDNDSYLEMAGKAVNPVMKPLGFDWPATVAALAGVPAKEIVVSTLGVLYTDDEAVSDQRLGDRLKNVVKQDGHPAWPMASALSFMVSYYCIVHALQQSWQSLKNQEAGSMAPLVCYIILPLLGWWPLSFTASRYCFDEYLGYKNNVVVLCVLT